jgi:putative tryptophan/tyrosine transport system substrate-binding protein
MMGLSNDKEAQARTKTFEDGLQREGWIIGENLRLEYRYADGEERLMQLVAADLIGLKCDCILGQSTQAIAVLQKLTRTIPIVFVAVTDPIGSGFVASLARPGGNITGFTIVQASISGKYLSMLRELSPQLTHAAIMYNPESVPFARAFFTPAFNNAAKELDIEPTIAEVGSATDIENAIARLGAKNGGALIIVPDNFTSLNRHLIIDLTAKLRIPAVYPYRYFAEAGGLLSYGMDAVKSFERAANYVSRILRGAKPADLPVQEPTKFELVINIRTARALGLAVPRILLASADAVIE